VLPVNTLVFRRREVPPRFIRVEASGVVCQGLGSLVGGIFDRLEVEPHHGFLRLRENVPLIATIGGATHIAGVTGNRGEVRARFSRRLSVDGVTRTLTQEIRLYPHAAILDCTEVMDYLSILEGRTVSFPAGPSGRWGSVEVTPLACNFNAIYGTREGRDWRALPVRFLLHRGRPR
jgi:hypothetical protein